eukprot:6875644-Pyramimonas_sp.AAC.1
MGGRGRRRCQVLHSTLDGPEGSDALGPCWASGTIQHLTHPHPYFCLHPHLPWRRFAIRNQRMAQA